MVKLTNVTKTYGETVAVNQLSLSAYPQEIFGLLGPNGAGKTTTIRMIMNIIAPDSGTVTFGGSRLIESDKDRVGYLPEERGLYRKVTVADMLVYLASLKNVPRQVAEPRLDSWLERLDLSAWKTHKIADLSKGMAQKIQFIAAIIHEPEFVFLDEPFAGLDPVSTDVLREAVVGLSKAGKTVLFSTHSMEQAERICHRIAIVDHGRVVIQGPVGEVKERYGKKSVALEFDGDIGFIDHHTAVKSIIHYPRWAEIELADGHEPDELLQLLAGRVSVRRFEVLQPSLHKIFVDHLGGKSGSTQDAVTADAGPSAGEE